MDNSQEEPDQQVKTEITSTLTVGSQVLINAQFLSGNKDLQLRDLHLGNHYSAQGDVNFYFANKDLFESGTHEQRRTALLNSLQYAGENAKRDQLDLLDIGPDNFSWVKTSPLCEWLQRGTTPFWISGKPGSGKSTLMRYLSDTRWVREELQRGSDKPWKTLHFFFDYRSGTEDANHLRGTFKSFLQQMIRFDKDVADFLLKPENDTIIKQSPVAVEVWIQLIADAANSTNTCFCALLDGLDEYEGSLPELCDQLHLLHDRTGIKLCIASRPEAAFRESFTDFQTIALQDYNGDSIRRYIHQRFARHKLFTPGMANPLTDKIHMAIQTRAEGVILWARLAIDHVLRSCDTNTSEEDVYNSLDTLQPEIESLYTQAFLKIPQQYQADAAWLLCLVASRITSMHPNVLFQAIAFTRRRTNSFLGGDLSIDTIHFRSKAILGNLLDFTIISQSSHPANVNTDEMPRGWEKRLTDKGKVYYIDHNTRTTSWKHPNETAAGLPAGWAVEIEPISGRTYFVNHRTRQTTWKDPREEQLVSIRAIHYTLAAYVTSPKWTKVHLSGIDSLYNVGQLWTEIFANVLTAAEQDDAVDVDASQSTMADFIRSRGIVQDVPRDGWWISIKTTEWQARSHLLRHSIYNIGTYLWNSSSTPRTSLEQSRILTLNTLFCHFCTNCVIMLTIFPDQRIVSRMRSLGRNDLVFACMHGLGSYIIETISSGNIEQEVLQLVFNLLLLSQAPFSGAGPGYARKDVFEKLSTEGVSLQAQHMCIFDQGRITYDSESNLATASQVNFTPWVASHSHTCRLYTSSPSVLSHWALCTFGSYEICVKTLQLFVRNGVTPEHSQLFDDLVNSANDLDVAGLLVFKLRCLSFFEQCKPEFNWLRKDAWGRTWKLRQDLAIRETDDTRRNMIRQDLDAVMACLSYFRKNKCWPDFDAICAQYIGKEINMKMGLCLFKLGLDTYSTD